MGVLEACNGSNVLIRINGQRKVSRSRGRVLIQVGRVVYSLHSVFVKKLDEGQRNAISATIVFVRSKEAIMYL